MDLFESEPKWAFTITWSLCDSARTKDMWRDTGATEMESSDASKKSMPTENILQNHQYDSFPQLAKNANYSSSQS